MASPVKNSGAAAKEVEAVKRGKVLKWLVKFNFTDRHVTMRLLRLQKSGNYSTIKKMIAAGLIGETRVNGCPVPVLHLKAAGLMAAQKLLAGTADETLTAPIHPSRINVAHVQHDLLVQRFLLQFSERYPGAAFLSEKQIQARNMTVGKGTTLTAPKVPDAIIYFSSGSDKSEKQAWALEVQETSEEHDFAERKISQYAEAISRRELYGLIYFSTTPSIVNRIEKIARGPVRRWWFNEDHKRWYPDDNEPSPVTRKHLDQLMVFVSQASLASQYYQYCVR